MDKPKSKLPYAAAFLIAAIPASYAMGRHLHAQESKIDDAELISDVFDAADLSGNGILEYAEVVNLVYSIGCDADYYGLLKAVDDYHRQKMTGNIEVGLLTFVVDKEDASHLFSSKKCTYSASIYERDNKARLNMHMKIPSNQARRFARAGGRGK